MAFKLEIVGSLVLSIVALEVTKELGVATGVISSATTSVSELEKSTLNELLSGVTSAEGWIFKVFEKAAKPTDNPMTPTTKARIAII